MLLFDTNGLTIPTFLPIAPFPKTPPVNGAPNLSVPGNPDPVSKATIELLDRF
jgi:hypothetical protein